MSKFLIGQRVQSNPAYTAEWSEDGKPFCGTITRVHEPSQNFQWNIPYATQTYHVLQDELNDEGEAQVGIWREDELEAIAE